MPSMLEIHTGTQPQGAKAKARGETANNTGERPDFSTLVKTGEPQPDSETANPATSDSNRVKTSTEPGMIGLLAREGELAGAEDELFMDDITASADAAETLVISDETAEVNVGATEEEIATDTDNADADPEVTGPIVATTPQAEPAQADGQEIVADDATATSEGKDGAALPEAQADTSTQAKPSDIAEQASEDAGKPAEIAASPGGADTAQSTLSSPAAASIAAGNPQAAPPQDTSESARTDTAPDSMIDAIAPKEHAESGSGLQTEASVGQAKATGQETARETPLFMPTSIGPANVAGAPAGAAAPLTQPGLTPASLLMVPPTDIPNVLTQALATGQDGTDRVLVQLDPPELGRVSLDFKFDAQGLQSVTITSETPEAMRRMRTMHFELIQALEQHGLSGNDLTFSHQQSGQQQRHVHFSEMGLVPHTDTHFAWSVTPPTRSSESLTSEGLDIRV